MENPIRICIFLLSLLASCTNSKPRNNSISKIALSASGCFGTCPAVEIEIDSSLTYKFHGGRYAEKQGFYAGKISRQEWDSLNIEFEKINFKSLDTTYEVITDAQTIRAVIFYDNRHNIISGSFSSTMPRNVFGLLFSVMTSYKRLNLVPSKDSIQFPREIQSPPTLSSPAFDPPKS